MSLSDILIITSIITGLISIPFLVVGPLSDYIPTGKVVLGLNESDVKGIPGSFSKILTSEKFEKTYETAFGRIKFSISSGKIEQELTRPDRAVKVTESPDETVWEITTQVCALKITRTHEKTIEECTTSDGFWTKIKNMGGVEETFKGYDPDLITKVCSECEDALSEEVERLEQVKRETVLPEIEGKACGEPVINIVGITRCASPEWVEIKNNGDCAVNMTDWTLSDEADNTYTFPEFILAPSTSVKVHSGYTSCSETSTVLCWRKGAVWNNDKDVATLKDADGNVTDTYSYEDCE